MPLLLNEGEVLELLTPAEAVAAVEACSRRMAEGVVEIAPRRRLSLEEGRLADMAASDLGLGFAGVKAYAGFASGATFVVSLFAAGRPETVQVDALGSADETYAAVLAAIEDLSPA